MTVTQTVDIPAPKRKLTAEEEVEFFKQNADRLNKQAEENLEFLCDIHKEYFERRRKENGS